MDLEVVERCPDCQVEIGQYHRYNCDVARCLYCGGQAISCICTSKQKGKDTWKGYWPGKKECHEYGFFCYWDGEVCNRYRKGTWVPCTGDHPEATEDLYRLMLDCKWDREQQKFTRKSE